MANTKSTNPAPAVTGAAPTWRTRTFDLSGTSIAKADSGFWRDEQCDRYAGPLAELLAVGIVRSDQLPPPGVKFISWSQGKRVTRNCKRDETYLQVNLHWETPVILVGLDPAHARARKKAAEQERAARDRAEEKGKLDQAARSARQNLEAIPKTELDYRRILIRDVRTIVKSILDIEGKPSLRHGFMVEPDSVCDILASTDAVVEAIMAATLRFDAQRQAQIIGNFQRQIIDADPDFSKQIKTLVQPNLTILQGEEA